MGNSVKIDLQEFKFRGLHPGISIGTASDRYAGWIGQVYSEGRYTKEIKPRTHKIGEKSYTEEVLPIESVEEYFERFPILEIDYTFYQPLLDKNGKPTPNYFTLKEYQKYLKKDEHLILKVPQSIFARRIRQDRKFVENEDYLNPQIFTSRFYKPAVEILVYCFRKNFTHSVIPDLIRNPVFSFWIPAFAGMTTFRIIVK